MRWRKAWIIARKDIDELKTRKYVIYTLVFMPLFISVFMPLTTLMPLRHEIMRDQTQGGDFQLDLRIVDQYDDVVLNDTYINNTYISNSTVINCNVNNSVLYNVSLENTVVNNSMLLEPRLTNVIISNSQMENVQESSRVMSYNTTIEGQQNRELMEIFDTMLSTLLIFFMMVPAIVPTVIASYSMIGEKTNKSLEPLLATPTTDREILAGKSLAVVVLTMAATYLSFIPFAIIVETTAYPVLGKHVILDPSWIIGIVLLAPLFCLMSIELNILISSKVTDVRASQQIGGLVIIPIMVIFIGSMAGIFTINAVFMVLFAFLIGVLDLGILYFSEKTFQRETILIKWK